MIFEDFNDFLKDIEVEVERFKRYRTPLTVVVFSIKFNSKDLEINYLHKIMFDLRVKLEQKIRKTDSISRYRNSLFVSLKNLAVDKSVGFINRFFESIDKDIKESYKKFINEREMVLVDVIINVYLISLSENVEEKNVIFINDFSVNSFLELINSIDDEKVFEKWDLRIPIIERI